MSGTVSECDARKAQLHAAQRGNSSQNRQMEGTMQSGTNAKSNTDDLAEQNKVVKQL